MDTRHGVVAQDRGRADLVAMAGEIVQMLQHVHDGFGRLDWQVVDQATELGRLVHTQEKGVLEHLARRSVAAKIAGEPVDEDVVFVPMHLERIAENVERLGASTVRVVREGTLFTDRARREVGSLMALAIQILESVRDAITTDNLVLVRHIIEAGRTCETLVNEYAHFHEKRLIEGVCQPRASSIYLMMLDDIRGIEWHARQIAEKLHGMPPPGTAPAGRRGRPIDL